MAKTTTPFNDLKRLNRLVQALWVRGYAVRIALAQSGQIGVEAFPALPGDDIYRTTREPRAHGVGETVEDAFDTLTILKVAGEGRHRG